MNNKLKLLTTLNLSEEQLAEYTGFAPEYVQKWIYGNPGGDRVDEIMFEAINHFSGQLIDKRKKVLGDKYNGNCIYSDIKL